MRNVFQALAILSILFLTACKGKNSEPPPATVPVANITGYIVKPLVLANSIEASGTIIPMDEAELHPEVSGRITYLNIPEGKIVPAGTLLVKIFDADLQAQLQKLRVQLKLNQETEERQKKLLAISGISQQDYDLSVLQVSNSRADIDLVNAQISKTEIRAPFTGIIGLRKVSPGAMVSPATAIATIRATSELKLDFSVPEKYSSEVEVGDIVHFTTAGSDSFLTAKVIANEKQVSAETRNMNVRAIIQRNSFTITPGAYALVHLKLGENNKALLIPTEAVIPAARDKSVIVSRGGKATFVKIKTGARNSDKVEVTDGLQEGDTIATTGILFLKPDAPLKFNSIKN
ncbi:MAG: efflux RND transporter periplasmic adaptor subunit [Chitinophagales bacterium]